MTTGRRADPQQPASGGDRRPVPWAGARALGDTALVYLGALILLGVVVGVLGGPSAVALPLLVVASPLALIAVEAGWLTARYGSAARWVAGPRGPRGSDLWVGGLLGIACFVGQFVIVLPLVELIEGLGGQVPQVQETFFDIARDPRTAPLLALAAVLLAPVAEEVLFRGVLFQGLAHRGVWFAAIVSAVAFTVPHLELDNTVLANVLIVSRITPLGVVFAYVLHRRGSLLATVVTHATYNAFGVALLVSAIEL